MNNSFLSLDNVSIYIDKFNQTCSLNQYALIENTNRLPKLAFFFALATFFFLFVHLWIIPFFHDKSWFDIIDNAFVGFAFATSIWTPLILMYFTFSLDMVAWRKVEFEILLTIIFFIVLMLFIQRKKLYAKIVQFFSKYANETNNEEDGKK